ncbi:MAG: regulatory protein RecX [Candidatus Roizmanbacteria bacterium]
MKNKEGFQKLLNKSYKYLERRIRTEYEMRTYLERKCKQFPQWYDATAISDVMKKLLALKYLNDWEFINSWVVTRLALKPKGEYGLSIELQKKGVKKDLIHKYFEENPLEEDALALAFVSKIASKYFPIDRLTKQKLFQKALRRGFKSSSIIKAFAEIDKKK